MSDELYTTLGVGKTASDDEIRKAYRRLVKTCHPDTNPNDKRAEERFKALGRAYAILGDPDKRKRYDRGLIDADGNERGPQGFGSGFGGFDPDAPARVGPTTAVPATAVPVPTPSSAALPASTTC
ncbi:MAG: J domain-containing protein [Geminicoccaceae bacterium]